MNFIHELKRRNVIQVALLYLVAGWLILQVADVLFGNLGAPEWAFRLVLGLLVLFFFPVLIFAWIFELTADGIRRDDAGSEAPPSRPNTGQRSLGLALALLLIVIGIVAADRLVPERMATSPPGPDEAEMLPARELTIAVLPFVNISPDPEQEYLADGLTEELLHLLSRATDLRVIGRTSSFEFKDRGEDLRAIGEQLGASHILEGSLRKSNATLRISAQLIDAADGVRVWSETYERDSHDLLAIQDSIAQAVVAALEIEFLGIASDHAHDSEAYDLYLRGLHAARVRSPEGMQRALEYFQRATERDPSFAAAWVQLGKLYVTNTNFWRISPDESVERIRSAIDKALALDPDSAEAHAVLGSMKMAFELDWQGASDAFRRAYAIDPDDPTTLRARGALAAARGDTATGIEFARRLQRVDPLGLSGFHNEAFFLYLARDHEAAAAGFRRARALAGGPYASGPGMLALTLLARDRAGDALEELAREPIEPLRLATASIAHYRLGEAELADAAFATLREKYGNRAAVPIAGAFGQRGDFDSAFEWFDRAYQQRDPQLLWTLTHPVNDPLRDDPRFERLLARLKLSPQP